MKKIISLLLPVILTTSFLFCDLSGCVVANADQKIDKPRLLIIPFKTKGKITEDEVSLLTDLLAVEIYKSGRFTIVNRDDMKAILSEKEFELVMGCEDNVCLLENVEKLAVNKIISGKIGALGKKYAVTMRLINENGENEVMEREICDCSIEGLDKSINRIAIKFLNNFGTTEAVLPPQVKREIVKPSVSVNASTDYVEQLTGTEMVFIKGGCYVMGDTFGDGRSGEKPLHEVCVDDFYLGKYEVTQGEWQKIIGKNPSCFKNGDNYPVEQVSWKDAQKFIMKLNKKSKKKYRLPTEAEWEYAARSRGKKVRFAGTNDKDQLYKYANFCDLNCKYDWKEKKQDDGYGETAPVGSYKPNDLGFYDMSGNVWEWVEDIYSIEAYKEPQRNNPIYTESGSGRVLRGGSWSALPRRLRASHRYRYTPDGSYYDLGFRLARNR